MPINLNSGQTVSFTVSAVDAKGNSSSAALSGLAFATSDSAVFTVAPDPANPHGGIVTAGTPPTSPDSAVITATATATEPDGKTTEQVSGSDTVSVNIPTPPPAPAASLVFSWGTPQGK